jgi:hypothetical protein
MTIPDEASFRPFTYERERLGDLGIEARICDASEATLIREAADAEVLFNFGGL